MVDLENTARDKLLRESDNTGSYFYIVKFKNYFRITIIFRSYIKQKGPERPLV